MFTTINEGKWMEIDGVESEGREWSFRSKAKKVGTVNYSKKKYSLVAVLNEGKHQKMSNYLNDALEMMAVKWQE